MRRCFVINKTTVPYLNNVFTVTDLCDMAKFAHTVTVSAVSFIYFGKNIVKL
jgi:hypothetical protein